MKNLDAVTKEALELPLEQRTRLAERILDSLDDLSEQEIERLGAQEAARRVAAHEAGEIDSHSAGAVHETLRDRLIRVRHE